MAKRRSSKTKLDLTDCHSAFYDLNHPPGDGLVLIQLKPNYQEANLPDNMLFTAECQEINGIAREYTQMNQQGQVPNPQQVCCDIVDELENYKGAMEQNAHAYEILY